MVFEKRFLPFILMAIGINTSAQQEPASNVLSSYKYLPFQKGNYEMGLERIGSFYNYNNYNNDVKYAHTNDLKLKYDFTKFYWDRIGIGAELKGNWSGTHNQNSDESLTRMFSLGVHVAYGIPISNNISAVLNLGPEYNWSKDISKSGSDNTTLSGHGFGFSGGVSFPIHTCENTYISPSFCYDYCNSDYSTYTISRSEFEVGVRIVEYMSCKKYWDYDYKTNPIRNYYNSGLNFVGFGTRANVGFGSYDQKYNGASNKIDLSKFNFSALYGHYVAKDVAIGIDFDFSSNVQKSSGNKNTTTDFIAYPLIRFNFPFYTPLYLQGEYGFGSSKASYTSNGSTSENKFNISGYSVYLGYNAPMNNNLALELQAGYARRKYGMSGGSDIIEKGPEFQIGIIDMFR